MLRSQEVLFLASSYREVSRVVLHELAIAKLRSSLATVRPGRVVESREQRADAAEQLEADDRTVRDHWVNDIDAHVDLAIIVAHLKSGGALAVPLSFPFFGC